MSHVFSSSPLVPAERSVNRFMDKVKLETKNGRGQMLL